MYPTLSSKQEMRKSYLRVGWATVAVALFPTVASLFLALFSEIPLMEKYIQIVTDKYFLFFNEALIGLAVLVGFLCLLGTRAKAPERQRISFGGFFALFAICIALSTIGNYVGQLWTMPIDMILGVAEDDLTAVILAQSPWQVFLCVGILAPILEEFFFRKLLIDRLHPHGEFLAILTSGFLFGLFHQNVGQYFYTFLIGLVIAYLYCKTGSYLLTVLMHAFFNLFNGVLPSFALPKVTEFLTKAETISTPDQLVALLPDYGFAVFYYAIHVILLGTLTILGIVLLIVNFKKIRIKAPPPSLSVWDMGASAYLNAGMLTAVILLLNTTIFSLFL